MGKENNKLVSILSYFLVGIIWYFVDEEVRKSKEVKFHVKQALNIAIISVAVSVAFSWMAFISFGLFYSLFWVIRLGIFVLWLIGLINAINMEKREIPLVGSFAEKYLTF